MKARILSYRRGLHTQNPRQFIVEVGEKAKDVIGKKAYWKSSSGKRISGKVTALHGKKGAVRLQMEKGLPGQAIGTDLTIEE